MALRDALEPFNSHTPMQQAKERSEGAQSALAGYYWRTVKGLETGERLRELHAEADDARLQLYLSEREENHG